MATDLLNQWEQPESESRLELVFSDRNKSYGAYKIRLNYRKHKVLATVIACGFMALISATPLIQELWKKGPKGGSQKVRVEAKTLDEIKEPEEEKKEDQPPPEAPKPQIATQQFTVPEFDPNTQRESDLPPNNQVSNPGQQTQQGQQDYFPTDDNSSGNGGPFDQGDKAPVKADVQAKFVGGDEAFIEYVKANFQYPTRCQEEGINGYVLLRFVVDTRGKVSNVVMLEETKACPEFTEEAIKVLNQSPPWVPGMVGGRFVKSYRVVPIRLNLN